MPTLIVAHAQHPLSDGLYPGREFTACLDTAAQTYQLQSEEDMTFHGVIGTRVYVPGSRHQKDQIALSDAGLQYLVNQHAVPLSNLFGREANDIFRPDRGVYHSGDEAYVAAALMRRGNFDSLIAVCALSQIGRLTLHYNANGIDPVYQTPQVQNSPKQPLVQVVESGLKFYTKHADASWQTGILPAVIRAIRRPMNG